MNQTRHEYGSVIIPRSMLERAEENEISIVLHMK